MGSFAKISGLAHGEAPVKQIVGPLTTWTPAPRRPPVSWATNWSWYAPW